MPEAEKKVLDFLNTYHIEYEYVSHKSVYTMADCAEIDEIDESTLYFKNLFLCNRPETEFYILIISGSKKFRAAQLSKQIGSSRLSFASDSKLFEKLGLLPGAVSPFGLINDTNKEVGLLIDDALLEGKRLAFHPNHNSATIILTMEGFFAYLEKLGVQPVTVTI